MDCLGEFGNRKDTNRASYEISVEKEKTLL